MQDVDEDSDEHEYVNIGLLELSPQDEQKLKEERNSAGTAEFIKHHVVPRQPLARHKAAGIAQSLVVIHDREPDLDRQTEQLSEEALSKQTSQHSLQDVDEDSDEHEYVNIDLLELSPQDEQKLKEERSSTGTAESIKHHVVPRQPLARHKAAGIAQSLVESRDDTEVTAADLPKCEKCGRTFPWNQLHLRWKHTCEPSEATGSPQPRRRSKTSAPDFESSTRRVSREREEEPISEQDSIDASLTMCRCGKLFDCRRDFIVHTLACSKGSQMNLPGARRRSSTLPK